jgi:hypothetical protein
MKGRGKCNRTCFLRSDASQESVKYSFSWAGAGEVASLKRSREVANGRGMSNILGMVGLRIGKNKKRLPVAKR